MKRTLHSVILLSLLILQGCACHFSYEFDGGRNYKESNLKYRYSAVSVDKIGLELNVFSDQSGIEISRTHYSPWISVDSLRTEEKVIIIDKKLSFSDGTFLEKKWKSSVISAKCYDNDGKEIPCGSYYYTCDNFKEKFKKNKHLNLKLVYDLDSLGVVTHHEKEYQLVKRRYCRAAVH